MEKAGDARKSIFPVMSFLAYSEINLFCIAITIMLACKVRSSFGDQHSDILLNRVFVSGTALLICDFIWELLDAQFLKISIPAKWIFNMGYFLVCGWFAYCWFLYSETKQNSRFIREPKYMAVLLVPMAIIAIIVLSSYFTKLTFYIDDQGKYHRGPLNVIQMFCAYGPILSTSVKAYMKSRKARLYLQKKELQSLAVFIIAPILTGLAQFFVTDVPLLCVGITFSAVFFFTSLQDHLISIDPLTDLNNRYQLEKHLEQAMDAQHVWQDELYLCVLDMDHFKNINDKFGHIEGDRALKIFAGILKRNCKNSSDFVSRFGGDEFIIVSKSSKEYVQQLCENILAEVHEKASELPYKFGVTIGVAKYSGKYKNSAEFINSADKEMYQSKQEHR